MVLAATGSFSLIQAASSSISLNSCWTRRLSIRRCLRSWVGCCSWVYLGEGTDSPSDGVCAAGSAAAAGCIWGRGQTLHQTVFAQLGRLLQLGVPGGEDRLSIRRCLRSWVGCCSWLYLGEGTDSPSDGVCAAGSAAAAGCIWGREQTLHQTVFAQLDRLLQLGVPGGGGQTLHQTVFAQLGRLLQLGVSGGGERSDGSDAASHSGPGPGTYRSCNCIMAETGVGNEMLLICINLRAIDYPSSNDC